MTDEQPSTKDNYERSVSDVCQSEFAHVLFKQTGDRETVRQRRAVPHLRLRNPSQTGLSACVEPI